MKRTLLFVPALAVIPVGVDAQVTPSASCAALSQSSPLEDLRSCAEQGNADAQTDLGLTYDLGRGVPEDDAEAVRWWRLAAEQGNALAQYSLGSMYANGEGVPEDYVLAYMWWNLAAAQGVEDAQGNKDIAESSAHPRRSRFRGSRQSTVWLFTLPRKKYLC